MESGEGLHSSWDSFLQRDTELERREEKESCTATLERRADKQTTLERREGDKETAIEETATLEMQNLKGERALEVIKMTQGNSNNC